MLIKKDIEEIFKIIDFNITNMNRILLNRGNKETCLLEHLNDIDEKVKSLHFIINHILSHNNYLEKYIIENFKIGPYVVFDNFGDDGGKFNIP